MNQRDTSSFEDRLRDAVYEKATRSTPLGVVGQDPASVMQIVANEVTRDIQRIFSGQQPISN
jgi:hypothetical protein